MTCQDARSDTGWVARRLGIPVSTAREAVDRLLRLGLLAERDDRWIKTEQHLLASVARPDTMMRLFHKDMVSKSLTTIAEEQGVDAFARRDLLSMTVAINPAKLDRAREIVTEFQKKIVECLSQDPCTEVYQFNVQLLPLTRPGKDPK
jgi:uncharacterized protein (TIGR02147 family)